MRRSIIALIIAVAAFSANAETTHRCTQTSITANETQRFITIELVRSGNIIKPSVGTIQIIPRYNWFLPRGVFRFEFAKGEIRKSLQIDIDDDVYTGTQITKAVCGGTVDGVTDRAQSEVAITIEDDELPPALIAPPLVEVTETDASQTIEIPLSLTARFSRGGSVRIEATSPDARRDLDYQVPRYVLFDPEERTDALRFTVVGDEMGEDTEEVLLTLSGDVPKTEILVRIADDEPLPVGFDKTSYVFAEQSPAIVTITRGSDLSTPLDAILQVTSPGPYPWPDPIPVRFAAGEKVKTVEIPFADLLHTGARAGFISLISNLVTLARATVVVLDDDPVPVLSMLAISAREVDPPFRRELQFRLLLTGAIGYPLRLRVKSFDGTADASDYIPIDETITIPAGARMAFFSVVVLGDDLVEPNETFGVTISDCCGVLATIANATATTTILNDDEALPRTTYRFEDVPVDWNESQRWLPATIVRQDNLDVPSFVSANLILFQPGRSFDPITVRFEPGESRRTVRFYIDDPFFSPQTNGELTLQSSRGLEDTRAIVLNDDEPKPVVSIEGFDVLEGTDIRGERLRISVEPRSTVPIQLLVALKNASDRVAIVPELVHIPARGTGGTMVQFLGDEEPDPDVTFVVTMTLHPTSSPATIGTREALCRIRDDDAAGARLLTAREIFRGRTANVTVTLDAPAPMDDVLRLSTTSPATLGIPATFPIAAGSRNTTFKVEGLRAGVAELKVTLPASLGSGELETTMSVNGLSVPVVPAATQSVRAGEIAEVDVAMSPPLDYEVRLPTQSLDNRILQTDHELVVPAGGVGKLRVRAVNVGRGTIEITVPDELGSSVVHVPFDVIPARD